MWKSFRARTRLRIHVVPIHPLRHVDPSFSLDSNVADPPLAASWDPVGSVGFLKGARGQSGVN